MRSSDCPLFAVHTRLEDISRLWVQAAESYFDADNFRANLNACIQSLRSVTWILQKKKSLIADFDVWYGEWQRRMKDDNILRWLVEARNQIEKEGDLETYSTVKVSVLANWNEPPHSEFKVSPFLSTEAIASNIQLRDVPKAVQQTGILSVERRWISSTLPSSELLDALAHASGFMTHLIKDAHDKLGIRTSFGDIPQPTDGRLPMMVSLSRYRSVYIKLSTGEFLMPETKFEEEPKGIREAAKQRYDLPDFTRSNRSKPPTLIEMAENFFEIGKKILKKDGHHNHIVILILPNGQASMLTLELKDRSEKYLGFFRVAEEVERTGAQALINIVESWIAPLDPSNPNQTATDWPNRLEVLTLSAISSQGEEYNLLARFEHRGEQIEIGPTQKAEGMGSSFLDPIRRVWAKQKR
ncbi:MAG: hypothetical protein ACE5H0_11505 [Bacteroidota bacterium]